MSDRKKTDQESIDKQSDAEQQQHRRHVQERTASQEHAQQSGQGKKSTEKPEHAGDSKSPVSRD